MSKEETPMHVVTLTPEEQLTVVLLSQNYLKLMARLYMTDLTKMQATETDVGDRWSRFCRTHDMLQELTQHMPTQYTFEQAKPRLYNFSSKGIKALLKLFELYNPSRTDTMEMEAIQIVETHFDSLKDKLTESSKFQFSSSEIEKEMRGR